MIVLNTIKISDSHYIHRQFSTLDQGWQHVINNRIRKQDMKSRLQEKCTNGIKMYWDHKSKKKSENMRPMGMFTSQKSAETKDQEKGPGEAVTNKNPKY